MFILYLLKPGITRKHKKSTSVKNKFVHKIVILLFPSSCKRKLSHPVAFFFFFLLKKEAGKREKISKRVLDIKKKYGKNAILRGLNSEEGAAIRKKNEQIGGHKA